MKTGERMKQLRKEKDIPMDAIAEAMNVSVATVYRYENGDIEKVPGNMLDPLSKVLDTTPAYLMGWEDIVFHETSTGNIDINSELSGLISRLKTSTDATFEKKVLTVAEKSMIENTLQNALDNLKMIVDSRK